MSTLSLFIASSLIFLSNTDYDKWEMEEYQKTKAKAAAAAEDKYSSSGAKWKEELHMRERQEAARNKKKDELGLVRSMMSKEKIEEMKRKKQLQAQLEHAFKTGDRATYQRLKKRLEPEEK